MTRLHCLTLALLGTLAATPALAQDSASGKHVSVVGGVALSEPTHDATLGGVRAEADGEATPTLSATWNINDHVGVEAWGAVDAFGHRLRTGDGKVGSVDAQPVALSAQYHFRDADATVRPFVGLGYHQTNFDEETTTAGGALAGQRVGVETAKGAIATAGVDVNFSPTWFARADVRYLDGDSDVMLDGAKAGEARLDPVVVGVGIGARF